MYLKRLFIIEYRQCRKIIRGDLKIVCINCIGNITVIENVVKISKLIRNERGIMEVF